MSVVSKLEKLLGLNRLTPTKFITRYLPAAPVGSKSTFGGTLVAQSLLASMNTVPRNFIPSSLHCYFISGGHPEQMITYDVESLREGRNFIHKEVRAYQNQKLIFQSMILFAAGRHDEPDGSMLTHLKKITLPDKNQYTYAADLFKEEVAGDDSKTRMFQELPIVQGSGGMTHINKVYNSFKTQPMEYYFPKNFFHSEKEIRNNDVNYYVRIRKDSVETRTSSDSYYNENDLISPHNDERYNYAAFAYLSDSYLLLALPYFSNMPLYSHKFSVSLDHSVYFHQLPQVNDLIYLNIKNSRSADHRHLMQGEYFDSHTGKILASVSQEGLVIYESIKQLKAKL
ncbi:similar to Saccharomyces cerevisiae YJR019C TES1 Peroxisomal acyl-CoA thioesterase likely to be involved in fatty acid oxidation rather than fatty acid synthesis [Maudiozyma barnettii]|uniref:Similar to Saccharomyces cerevisiae YJR019C TES1 Peroxisomal acyl-CoA thioesterase likely to be involved in fatty acid oxidation rather than fatty acid synthesis n=1 Tax=Maudiozyma barnettii TaxID=61262 RepID=A0A8H2VGA9_9SACH|nr:palmitoyl-CoA hydrolase [Kazachstania barnettii]CAB4254901.1 similar to Saccharomyces cerevisiae YJR019C TES1 Peroxisomal acyl-CoA thioesterase likely to be involved in fatty acid oxidation rather than fatty acid synthesis [Kazachstania barnettii]CAD1783163.1 similar to Saccharomyces cerevisiae YJR019C TES1 Peroxisomal acyl-CoA thioesterase likely to be involved in fatty acid oxidation rather than fatty acid synthesis [Kazachstania barnettii]